MIQTQSSDYGSPLRIAGELPEARKGKKKGQTSHAGFRESEISQCFYYLVVSRWKWRKQSLPQTCVGPSTVTAACPCLRKGTFVVPALLCQDEVEAKNNGPFLFFPPFPTITSRGIHLSWFGFVSEVTHKQELLLLLGIDATNRVIKPSKTCNRRLSEKPPLFQEKLFYWGDNRRLFLVTRLIRWAVWLWCFHTPAISTVSPSKLFLCILSLDPQLNVSLVCLNGKQGVDR